MPTTKTYSGAFTIEDITGVSAIRAGIRDGDEVILSHVAQATMNTPDGLKTINAEISQAKYEKVVKILARPVLKEARNEHPGTTVDNAGTDSD